MQQAMSSTWGYANTYVATNVNFFHIKGKITTEPTPNMSILLLVYTKKCVHHIYSIHCRYFGQLCLNNLVLLNMSMDDQIIWKSTVFQQANLKKNNW